MIGRLRYGTFVPGSGAAEDDCEHNGKTDQHHVDGVQPGILVAVVQQPAHNTGIITGCLVSKHHVLIQYRGCGMFIPDPNFSIPDPIPDPGSGSASKNIPVSIFNPKNCF